MPLAFDHGDVEALVWRHSLIQLDDSVTLPADVIDYYAPQVGALQLRLLLLVHRLRCCAFQPTYGHGALYAALDSLVRERAIERYSGTAYHFGCSSVGVVAYQVQGFVEPVIETLTADDLRRMRMHENGGSHTDEEWAALKAMYGYRCLACGRREPFIKLTKDHVKPVVAGGSDNIDNIQPLCKSCNSHKNSREIDYRPQYGAALCAPE